MSRSRKIQNFQKASFFFFIFVNIFLSFSIQNGDNESGEKVRSETGFTGPTGFSRANARFLTRRPSPAPRPRGVSPSDPVKTGQERRASKPRRPPRKPRGAGFKPHVKNPRNSKRVRNRAATARGQRPPTVCSDRSQKPRAAPRREKRKPPPANHRPNSTTSTVTVPRLLARGQTRVGAHLRSPD